MGTPNYLYDIFKKGDNFCDFLFASSKNEIQSVLVISTSVISNNRLSRRKNLVLVITQKSKIRL